MCIHLTKVEVRATLKDEHTQSMMKAHKDEKYEESEQVRVSEDKAWEPYYV